MKQNRVYVIYKKLYTIIKDLKLYVAFCRVQRKKFNKKVLKRTIKNLVLLATKTFKKKTETVMIASASSTITLTKGKIR